MGSPRKLPLPPLRNVARDGHPQERRESGLMVGSRMRDKVVVIARLVEGAAEWTEEIEADEAERFGLAVVDAARRARRGEKARDDG